MFNYEDILAQMKNGATAEDVAKAFTTSLNQAIKAQEEEKAKLIQKEQMYTDAQQVADVFNAFASKYYGAQTNQPVSGEEIIQVFDLITSLDIKVDKLKNGVATTVKFGKDSLAGLEGSVDKIIDNFLKKYGL